VHHVPILRLVVVARIGTTDGKGGCCDVCCFERHGTRCSRRLLNSVLDDTVPLSSLAQMHVALGVPQLGLAVEC